MTDIPTPENRLHKNLMKSTIINEVLENIVILIVLGILTYISFYFDWKLWISRILISLIILTFVASIWSIAIRPYLIYRNTRYGVDEQYLQIKTGAIFEEHTLVPMTKIQAVETKQGPIMRKFGIYRLSVETMGSSHSIVGLSTKRAKDMRNKIAHYAKIKEVES